MKRFFYLLIAIAFISPIAFAQDHAEVGVYANYFRLSQTDTNFGGAGGRLSVNVSPYVQLEAEMSYDFDQVFTENFTNGTGVTAVRSNIRVLHGLFGPKVQTNKGPVRFFVTAKGGFVNFRFDGKPANFSDFTSSVENLRSDNVNGVFYPGGGAEAFWGPLGVRLDIGDEIYFNNGAHNNLRVSFGPTIRF